MQAWSNEEDHVNMGKLTKMARNLVDTKGDKIAAGRHRDKLAKLDDLARKLDKGRAPRAVADPTDKLPPAPPAGPAPASPPPAPPAP